MRILFSLILVLLHVQLIAQDIDQSICGKVVDKYTNQPLAGAKVKLIKEGEYIGDISDSDGGFCIHDLSPGRYSLNITFLGYQPKTVSSILVTSGKIAFVDIGLEVSTNQLGSIDVNSNALKEEPLNKMALVSARSFTIDEASRYAGSFDDPARMVLAYAGVQGGGDDIRNDISIRGNSPKGLQWRLEGVEIPNPNHFSDGLPSGGAVSMISGNVLANSDFLTGAFPAEYGNALSGVFDINLRRGNSQKREHALQVGLLGLEGSTEGPFSKNYNGSYLVNYRYSTLALIGSLIDAQNSKYQDLTYNIYLPTKSIGNFRVFGLMGNSAENEDERSGFPPIGNYFPSETSHGMSIFGLRNDLLVSKSSWLKFTVIHSTGSSLSRTNNIGIIEEPGNLPQAGLIRSINQSQNWTTRGTVELNSKLTKRLFLSTGLVYSWLRYDIEEAVENDLTNETTSSINQNGATSLAQGYFNIKHHITDNLKWVAGLHTTLFGLNNTYTIEPRFAVQWKLLKKLTISAGYGRHSRMEGLGLYLAEVEENNQVMLPNKGLGLTKADHFVVGGKLKITKNIVFSIEGYLQKLFEVPSGNGTLSSINFQGNEIIDLTLDNRGIGVNKGIDISLERHLNNRFYYLLTASIYKSTFSNQDKEYATSFDGRYASSFLLGREIRFKSNRRTLILGSKFLWNGGRPITPLLLQESLDSESIIEDDSRFHEARMEDYIRLDFQISYRIDQKRVSHFIKFDIQNILNRKNQLERFYDSQAESIQWRNQNGILPVMSYKILF